MKRKAFSLVELIVVISIIGIIVTVVAWSRNYRPPPETVQQQIDDLSERVRTLELVVILKQQINQPREKLKMTKPIVYIASPYSKGDQAANVHFQCKVFDELLTQGKVWPVVPLWSHFQHTIFPRPYEDWIEYDKAMLPLYNACLRLTAIIGRGMDYQESKSTGADNEVQAFLDMGKPVFYAVTPLYEWVARGCL